MNPMNLNAPWLEADGEFEGVGAHRENPRYQPVDEPGHDPYTGKPIEEATDAD